MKIVWTQNALEDLKEIREYLKQNESKAYVKKVTDDILAEVKELKGWPTKGTYVPELEDLHLSSHRQLLAGQHRIIVERGADETFYVHMVAHTSRDLEALIRRRLLTS